MQTVRHVACVYSESAVTTWKACQELIELDVYSGCSYTGVVASGTADVDQDLV
jgi:hypothetical protein